MGGNRRAVRFSIRAWECNFVTNATYTAPGNLAAYINGANLNTTNSYNKRLQPVTLSAINSGTGLAVLSLTYDFHLGTGDNGDVFQITNNRDGNRTQHFLYDSLDRIQQAYTTGSNWGETFSPTATAPGVPPATPGIDAWGNLTNRSGVTGKTNYEPLACPASTKNQLTTCSLGYDAAGNMTANGTSTYTYDAENRLVSTAGWTYVYDGDGHRVRKSSGSSGTLYWPDLTGNVLNESSLGATNLREYVYFAGKRVARIDVPAPLTVKYYFSDHLGSASVITDASGTILEESDYYPYGGEIVVTNNDANNYKFTGKERDAESGLDMFGARYYGSSLGRFVTPDWAATPISVPYADFGDPQTLNLYNYAHNSPIRFSDANGHCLWDLCVAESAAVAGVAALSVYIASPQGQEQIKRGAEAGVNAVVGALNYIDDKVTTTVLNAVSGNKDGNSSSSEANNGKNTPSSGENTDSSGKALPANPDDLKVDGYTETSHPDAAAKGHRTFENPETGDKVRFDKGKEGQPGYEGQDHYHRYNPNSTGKTDEYLDKDGNPVSRGSAESHLKPESK